MSFRSRLFRITVTLAGIIFLSTAGYVLIEHWSWFDAFYMTVITVSTVGFQYVHALSRPGEIFTFFVILGGTGTMTYSVITIVGYILEGQLGNVLGRRRMREEISKLTGHIILSGYGKVGQEVARVFQNEDFKFVIIESNLESSACPGYDPADRH